MTSKLKCPFCGEEIKIAGERTTIMSCFNGECCGSGLYGEEAMWQALIQSKQQLKMLEPIVASLQGRADINAEVARDSNELVVQWYEKYEQTQKDLEIARKALKDITIVRCGLEDFEPKAVTMTRIAEKALAQIEHIADVSKMVGQN